MTSAITYHQVFHTLVSCLSHKINWKICNTVKNLPCIEMSWSKYCMFAYFVDGPFWIVDLLDDVSLFQGRNPNQERWVHAQVRAGDGACAGIAFIALYIRLLLLIHLLSPFRLFLYNVIRLRVTCFQCYDLFHKCINNLNKSEKSNVLKLCRV